MKKTKLKIFLKSFLLSGLLIYGLSLMRDVFAADALVPCGLGGAADCTLCHLVIGVNNIFNYLLYTILFPLFTLGIVISGVLYMVSRGSKPLIEKAKKAFTYSLAAALIALCSWLLVNAILHALGYKNAGGWSTYTCDTTQTSGPGNGGDKKKCSGQCKAKCDSNEDRGEGTCEEGKACCVAKKTCESAGGICRIWNPSMEGQSKCEDDEEPRDQYICPNSGEVCCVSKASGKCEGKEGSCGGMQTAVSDQCKLSSPSLGSLLSCMSSKGAPGTITSITARNVGSDCEKSFSCCGDASCTHATYTCHYGCGMADQGYSHAADVGTGGWSDEKLCQLASIAKECGSGTIWGPRNMCGGNIRYQAGHRTHLHISTGACNH